MFLRKLDLTRALPLRAMAQRTPLRLRLPAASSPLSIASLSSLARQPASLSAANLSFRSLHTTRWTGRAPVPHAPAALGPRPVAHGAGSSGSSGSGGKKKPTTPYGVFYRELVPAMIPIFVLSTAIFLALSLLRTYLSHERSLAESTERIAVLEAQLSRLRTDAKRRQERERRERERILPIVVERVLQRVGAMGEEAEEEPYEERLLV